MAISPEAIASLTRRVDVLVGMVFGVLLLYTRMDKKLPQSRAVLVHKIAFSINANILMGYLGDKTSTFEQISSLDGIPSIITKSLSIAAI
jgi:Na+/H+ antiporter NhaC